LVYVIGYLRFLVDRSPNSVTNEFPHNAKTISFHVVLDRPRNVGNLVSRPSLSNTEIEGVDGDIHQFLGRGRASSDCNCHGDVSHESSEADPHIEFHKIAILKPTLGTDPMYDPLVYRDTAVRREVSVTKKGTFGTLLFD